MAALASFNDYINRASNGYIVHRHFGAEITSTVAALTGNTLVSFKSPPIYTVETMPSGVTGFRLTNATLYSSVQTTPYLLAKLVDLGTFTFGTGFVDGSAMPTVTEGGASRTMHSALLVEMVTPGTGTGTSITVNYTNQDGNAATTPAQTIAMTIVAYSCGFLPLATNDWGVRDVTGATRSAGTGVCTVKLWGVICMGMFNFTHQSVGVQSTLNFLTDTPAAPLLSAGDSLYIIGGGTSTRALKGTLTFVGEQA